MVDYILLEKYCKDITVLFVEDDENIRKETSELLQDIFKKEIIVAKDGVDAIEKYKGYKSSNGKYVDLVISDILMPNMNGVELTKEIYKENNDQEVIILSAHNQADYLMELVNIGIAQFIVKPLDFDLFIEVVFKVSKEIYAKNNEIEQIEQVGLVQIGNGLSWDNSKEQLFLEDELIKLTKKELLLVKLLLSNPEKTFTNEEILNHVWGDDLDSSPSIKNLKNIVWKLRKKVELLEIENIYSFGYRINIV